MAYLDLETKYTGGTFFTLDLLQDLDSNFAQAFNSTDETYTGTFTNATLAAGILTITHNLDTGFPKPKIRRPDNTYEDAEAIMTYVTNNQVTFDFGGSIAAGTWNIQIRS